MQLSMRSIIPSCITTASYSQNHTRKADVAATKRHQWLDEIWVIFTLTSLRKSAKLFSRKLCHAICALDT